MVSDNTTEKDASFIEQVRDRVRIKKAEYQNIKHEQKRLEVQAERLKIYIDQLNKILEAEGQPITQVIESDSAGSPVRRPGNRSLKFPTRKVEWEGMTLNAIVAKILNDSPNEVFHADVIAHKIYDIQSKPDVRTVKKGGLVSTLRRGVKSGLWAFEAKNKYRAITKRLM